MDLVAGAGGIFGQLAVGLAGGITDASVSSQLVPNGIKMAGRFGAAAPKPTIDALPDKVSERKYG